MKIKLIGIACIVLFSSCVSKKEIFYLQDVEDYNNKAIIYNDITIQPNDILNISVSALVPETAKPYNRNFDGGTIQQNSMDILRLQGYLVTKESTISFPNLGSISVENKTTLQLETFIKDRLTNEGHLVQPDVTVRIINAKVTVLGEVNNPGTYTFTEESITTLQAIGYAGDLTIQGKREDVLIMREVDGVRKIGHLDLTQSSWLDSDFSYVKPNDVIVINQNPPKVTSAGYIGNIATLLGVSTVILSVIILLTR
ncbi:polysaccharide biosynthesis/export family protein [Bizionia arctica]|uniref:Sugar transporter n=1 Tax=Bizionia arctica TaxID=1495645 RepID=A0A917LVY6_9FLAO|nr:polysaccharide biosynthesis/export family protein [Bizionia arctica]GGG60220.1 sugar transporter [Bizionia arctica]